MLDSNDIFVASRVMADALSTVSRDLAREDVGGEEDFSGQFVGRLKSAIDNLETRRTRWWVSDMVRDDDGPSSRLRISARQLRKRAEEPWVGADIVIVLSVEMPDYTVSKGILIQAKLVDEQRSLSPSTLKGLQSNAPTCSTCRRQALCSSTRRGKRRSFLRRQWRQPGTGCRPIAMTRRYSFRTFSSAGSATRA